MAELNYSYTVDVENPTTSHSQAVLLVAPGSTVLDIGAADGSVARPLAARGCRVWGIERDPGPAAKARAACERVFVGDVEEMDLQALLEGQKFDYILYLDVLEHLRDPLAALTRAREHLTPGGRVIASIPNVTHGAVRVSLMSGAFTYTETGLLDKTHLRFFDRPGAEGLFADARLRIVERLRVTRGLTETEIAIDPSAVPPQILQQLREDPDATTYQFIFVAVPADSAAAAMIAGASLAERLQHRVAQIEGTYHELEAYARSLEQQSRDQQAQIEGLTSRAAAADKMAAEIEALGNAARSVEDALQAERQRTAEEQARVQEERSHAQEERSRAQELRTELERRMEELSLRHVELRHLQADLAVKEAFVADLRRTIDIAAEAAARRESALQHESAQLRVAFQEELDRRQEELDRRADDVSALQAELGRTRETLDRLQVFVNSPGFRKMAGVARALSRYPRTYRFLQRVVRRGAGKPND